MSKSLGNASGIAEPPAEQFGKLLSIPDALHPVVPPVRDRLAASRGSTPRSPTCVGRGVEPARREAAAGPHRVRPLPRRRCRRSGPGRLRPGLHETTRLPREIPEFALAADAADGELPALHGCSPLAGLAQVEPGRRSASGRGVGAVDGAVVTDDVARPVREWWGDRRSRSASGRWATGSVRARAEAEHRGSVTHGLTRRTAGRSMTLRPSTGLRAADGPIDTTTSGSVRRHVQQFHRRRCVSPMRSHASVRACRDRSLTTEQ